MTAKGPARERRRKGGAALHHHAHGRATPQQRTACSFHALRFTRASLQCHLPFSASPLTSLVVRDGTRAATPLLFNDAGELSGSRSAAQAGTRARSPSPSDDPSRVSLPDADATSTAGELEMKGSRIAWTALPITGRRRGVAHALIATVLLIGACTTLALRRSLRRRNALPR